MEIIAKIIGINVKKRIFRAEICPAMIVKRLDICFEFVIILNSLHVWRDNGHFNFYVNTYLYNTLKKTLIFNSCIHYSSLNYIRCLPKVLHQKRCPIYMLKLADHYLPTAQQVNSCNKLFCMETIDFSVSTSHLNRLSVSSE